MATALKEFTLHGSRFQHGSPIPESVWSRCDKRTQVVLERNRFITTKAEARVTPAPRPRGRPRKAV